MEGRESLLHHADRWRHKIPFWWWITYDALVAVVILLGFFGFRDATLWLGFAVLAIAVVIDSVEFWVKRPANRAKLAAPRPWHELLDAYDLAVMAEDHLPAGGFISQPTTRIMGVDAPDLGEPIGG